MRRVGLIGAGFISDVHAEALRGLPGTRVSAIVDTNINAARRRARRWGVELVFGSVSEAIDEDAFDCAHVLVPPPAHSDVARSLIEAGKPVFMEKPFATSADQCSTLLAAAAERGITLGVNQNFVFHPAYMRLRRLIEGRVLGKARFLSCAYNVPVQQINAGQFEHWMFHAPGNMLLEQAVHPLSQIAFLAGRIEHVRAVPEPASERAPGISFYSTLGVTLRCELLPAQLWFGAGQSFPFWQITVICDDGTAVADMFANTLITYGRTRWPDPIDRVLSGGRMASAVLGDSFQNGMAYVLSTLRLARRSDAFFRSMASSISAYHAALDAARAPELDGRFGAMLVGVCETIRDQMSPSVPPLARTAVIRSQSRLDCDVAILGGTGFIGTHLVRRFLESGLTVSVMARGLQNVPEILRDDRVWLHRGDIGNSASLEDAIGNAPLVVNLAHGGGGESWEEICHAMVGGASNVARVCLARGVRRLIHVGSIAALYLGPQRRTITGLTPPDRYPERRESYSRAKTLCDRLLLEMHARDALPVCILRPGLVVGAGGTPFHLGVGFYNNEQHCMGWNRGRNSLPFVLVEDVAEAILKASQAENVLGRCYNLVGDVRLNARDYIALLGRALERPLHYHPQWPTRLWLNELGKGLVKRAIGRADKAPTRYDILSRGLTAEFDCSDAKRDLGWQPVADRDRFVQRAILVHAR